MDCIRAFLAMGCFLAYTSSDCLHCSILEAAGGSLSRFRVCAHCASGDFLEVIRICDVDALYIHLDSVLSVFIASPLDGSNVKHENQLCHCRHRVDFACATYSGGVCLCSFLD